MRYLTITIYAKTKARALEIVRLLQPQVQVGETIQYQIEDAEPEKKQENSEKLHKKAVKR